MLRALLALGGLLVVLFATACKHESGTFIYDASDAARWHPVAFEELRLPGSRYGELLLGSDRPAAIVLASQQQLDDAWSRIYPPQMRSVPTPPSVDFSSHSLLILSMGGRADPSSLGLSVTGVLESQDAMLVQVVQTWGGHGLTSIGDPVHAATMVLLPRSTKPVLVDRRNQIKVYDN